MRDSFVKFMAKCAEPGTLRLSTFGVVADSADGAYVCVCVCTGGCVCGFASVCIDVHRLAVRYDGIEALNAQKVFGPFNAKVVCVAGRGGLIFCQYVWRTI